MTAASVASDPSTTSQTLFNPGGGLLPAFSRLNRQQASEVGMIYGGFSTLCFAASFPMIWQGREFSIWELSLVGIVPFLGLTISGNIIRFFERNSGNFAADIFIAGSTLRPLSLAMLLIGLVPPSAISSAIPLILLLLMFGFCYAIITLYSGCAQILNLSEKKATFAVFLMLLISSWISYFAIILLIS